MIQRTVPFAQTLLALAVLGGSLGGCAEAEPFLPTVRFEGMKVNEVSWTDISTDFEFTVENPNPVRLGVASFEYALDLQDIPLISGDRNEGFQMQPQASSPLVLPVDLVFAETWDVVDAARGVDEIDFGLAGQFGFDTPIGMVEIPFNEAGAFPALRTPQLRFTQFRVAEVTLTDATLELDVAVDNSHGSTLFFDNFSYDLVLANEPVASGVINTFDVAGDAEGVVTLPIEINLLSAGFTIVDAIVSGGKLDLQMSAGTDVETPFGILPLTVTLEDALNLLP